MQCLRTHNLSEQPHGGFRTLLILCSVVVEVVEAVVLFFLAFDLSVK